MPPLRWTIDLEDGRTLHLFGGGPPTLEPWSDPYIEAQVEASDVFWNEAPEIGGDVQALAIKYGVDPAAPLATWLSPEDFARVERAAAATGASMQILEHVRPWLAAQILKMSFEERAGLEVEHAAERRLAAVAERAGVPVNSEFGNDAENVFVTLSSWPRQAEIERLLSTMAEVEAGPDFIHRQCEAWLTGDIDHVLAIDARYRAEYPALYEHLVVARNRRWVERISEMVRDRVAAFLVPGSAHLVGPDGVPALLEREGIIATPR